MKRNLFHILKFISVFSLLLLSCKTHKIVDSKSENSVPFDEHILKKQDSLAFELCQIYGFDQGIRNKKISKYIEKQQSIDTFNFNRIVDFVKTHGFPTKELVGNKNFEVECVEGAFLAVLLHNPHRLVNEKIYFNLFNDEVKKGNLKSERFANILDKYYWTKSKNKKDRRVFYGSQFGKPCIQTKDETNKARLEIGLKELKNSEFVDCLGEELHLIRERK